MRRAVVLVAALAVLHYLGWLGVVTTGLAYIAGVLVGAYTAEQNRRLLDG